MLATNASKYIFEIPDYTTSLAVTTTSKSDEVILRAVWVGHLTHEQQKADKDEVLRHPLAREIGKNFFHS